MYFEKRKHFKWVVLLLLMGLSVMARAQGIGEVTRLVGEADVTRGGQAAVALHEGDAIERQDILRTKSDSLLIVTLNDGSRLTLGAGTRLEVAQYATGDEPNGLVKATRGRVRAFVTEAFSKRKESFRVETPTAVVGVQGTDFETLIEALLTRINVYDGVVSTRNIDPNVPGTQILRRLQSTIVRKGEPPEPPTDLSPDADDQFGSGAGQYRQSGGEQGSDPTLLTPRVPSSVRTPPQPKPPGR